MALYRIRAINAPHPGYYALAGVYFPCDEWTERDMSPEDLASIEGDTHLLVELGKAPKNADQAKAEAVEAGEALAAEKKAHSETLDELVSTSDKLAVTQGLLDVANAQIATLKGQLDKAKA